MKLAIVDVGCGNIGAVRIAFERLGLSPVVTSEAETITGADRVVLPGVGAAGFAMRQIRARGLEQPLKGLAQPVLGVCLGMQIMFEWSEEEDAACLGVFAGGVRRLEAAPGRPVPHMGWSRLQVRASDTGLSDGDYVYYAHSFACDAGPDTVAASEHGREIPAVVRRANWLGAQFHPERSGPAGARFLQQFLKS